MDHDDDRTEAGGEPLINSSLVPRAIADGVENEKCVVSQYRTTLAQKETFVQLLESHELNKIPVEWVIDIADESSGWFYGTAYHFDNTNQMLHVMVPDKHNPSFDGHVPLDHRTVHLIECVDGNTDALFNKIIRDSVVKVRWEVEWFEEGAGKELQVAGDTSGAQGKWVLSTARYYIRMANQLLVEDQDFGNDSRGFVMLTADLNLRLRRCHKGKGLEDFNRLVLEAVVQSAPGAIEESVSASDHRYGSKLQSMNAPPVKRLADMSRGLRECLTDLFDEREQIHAERVKVAKAFTTFILNGDLDAGLKLMSHVDEIHTKERRKNDPDHQEVMEATADEAWYLCQRIEKGANKLAKSGEGNLDELEFLRRANKKLQKEVEEKERDIDHLRSKGGR